MLKSGKQTVLEELREAINTRRSFAEGMRVLEYLYMYQTNTHLNSQKENAQQDGEKILEYFYPGQGVTLFNQEKF